MKIKNYEEIKKMRISGKLASQALEMIEKYIIPGINTESLDNICHQYIVNKQKAKPACLGYFGYPKSICTSINEVVCHGVPNKNNILKNGDIINIDISIIKDGYCGDTSKMFFVGKPNKIAKKLCYIAQKSLYLSLKLIKPGIYLNNIGKKIQEFVEENSFSVVKSYCGHGIGKSLHEEPKVLHYYDKKLYNKIIISSGMIFTIEPMINIGKSDVVVMNDGWTVITKDKSLSAQYEHTVLVTKNGCEILTLRKDDKIQKRLINI